MSDDWKARFETMGEEERRARTEALEMGRMSIVEVMLGALLRQVPHPDLVEWAINIRLDELKAAQPAHPALAWSPPTIHAGAEAAARRILAIAALP